jgi:predicted RND superfamily exporter protein
MAPTDVKELDAMFEYSERFGGGGNFNGFLVETDPYGLEDPDVIKSIYKMENEMSAKGVEVASIASAMMDVHEILTANIILETFDSLGNVSNLIFNQIAERGIVDKEHSKTVIVVSIPVGLSIKETEKIVNDLNEIAEKTNLPRGGIVHPLTGQDAINVVVNRKLADEQSGSMIIALLLVLAALILIFNSSIYGFLTLIPVGFVLIWEPGFLVASNIPLSPITITIASIMVGIGIDYGVHITHRVREEIAKGSTKYQATTIAIEKTGISLVEAALTTIAGMASIYFVGIPALSEFVTVIIFMTSVAVIAAALLLPVFYEFRIVK